MLNKIFGTRKRKPLHTQIADDDDYKSSALKIIHAGGATECYYMAVPAARVIEKYPLFVLARPDIFRRPWGSVVQQDEILVPGQKFFLVPLQTVKKLQRRFMKTSNVVVANNSFVSDLSVISNDLSVSTTRDQPSGKSFKGGDVSKSIIRTLKSKTKTKAPNGPKHRVRFANVDNYKSVSMEKQQQRNKSLKGNNSKADSVGRKGRLRNGLVTWEPSLTMIAETQYGSDHE